MTMTQATQAINALRDTLKRGGVYINDSQVLRLAQLNFTPESNEVKMLLTQSTTVSELLSEVEKLPEATNSFDEYSKFLESQREAIEQKKLSERSVF